jgi:putative transposase
LDRMLIYNARPLLAVLGEFVAHYNEHRPHRAATNVRPPPQTPGQLLSTSTERGSAAGRSSTG